MGVGGLRLNRASSDSPFRVPQFLRPVVGEERAVSAEKHRHRKLLYNPDPHSERSMGSDNLDLQGGILPGVSMDAGDGDLFSPGVTSKLQSDERNHASGV